MNDRNGNLVEVLWCLSLECKYTAKSGSNVINVHNSIPRGEKCRMEIPDDEDLEGFLQCSVCKELVVDDRNSLNFCPNCGKEIEEVE